MAAHVTLTGPTYGFYKAMDLLHIGKGIYYNVRLDEIDVIFAASWPKSIHEGNGTAQLFISNKTTEDKKGVGEYLFWKGQRRRTIYNICKCNQV